MTLRATSTTTRACTQLVVLTRPPPSSAVRRWMSTNLDAPPNTPKRASPYRLFTPTSFLSAFAPLHVQGWRLLPLPSSASSSASISAQHGDLQDRRIVRIYELDQASGWKRSKAVFDRVHDLSVQLSHHPTISITPSADYTPPSGSEQQIADDTAYVVEVSMNTHTPYAPIGQPKNAGKMRPGVTMKDVTLASAVEEAYRGIVQGDAI